MENNSIYLGTYNLFNININLVLNITLYNNLRGSQVAKIKIPLPENYPLTQTGTSNEVKSKGIFEAELNIITDKNMSWYYYPIDSNEETKNFKRAVVLNKFYNVPKFEKLEITPEENIIFNGLGKKFLCIVFPYIIKYFNIDPNTTAIVLQASGGVVRTENDKIRVNQYLQLGKMGILEVYQYKYPEDFKYCKMLFDEYSDYELAEALVSLENNEKLIQYYTNAFGFKQLDYTSMETKMGTTLIKLLDLC